MQLFPNLIRGYFISRPNRFVVEVKIGRRKTPAFLPNPGRLAELFFPGSTLYLEKSSQEGRKYAYTVVGVEKGDLPVLLHTHKSNDVVEHLLREKLIPSFKKAIILKREFKAGTSRFDFLLQQGKDKILLEVKSCTLFSRRVAMFPDAPSERASRHVEELASLPPYKGAALVLVQAPHPEFFLPDYHTDLLFGQTMLKVRGQINIQALSIGWDSQLNLKNPPRPLFIPWEIVEKEARDEGSYLLLLHLPRKKKIKMGKLGERVLQGGYYIYIGSAQQNLTRKINGHRREKKNPQEPIDYLSSHARIYRDLPIRTADDLECTLAEEIRKIALEIPSFGSSDCSCSSHLFWTEKNPLDSHPFHNFLNYYRMDLLVEGL